MEFCYHVKDDTVIFLMRMILSKYYG